MASIYADFTARQIGFDSDVVNVTRVVFVTILRGALCIAAFASACLAGWLAATF